MLEIGFVFSLTFDSLQAIVDAFKDRYGDQKDSHSANYSIKKDDLVRDPTIVEGGQENVSHQSLPYCGPCDHFHDESTCAVARGILNSGRARTKDQINIDDEKENDKHLIKELKQMIKDMQFSQA